MIDDGQRREVARKLREPKESLLAHPDEELIRLRYETGCQRGQDIYERLADLIDRQTATASMDYEAMEDGVPDCRIWTCHRCNESFPVYRGFSPAYCQNCGAEVIG